MSTDRPYPHFLSGKSIFVIGAGLSGSAFVASLRYSWNYELPFPDITVLDRDPRCEFERRGGYSLSLVGNDPSGGLIPLRKMGILDKVLHSSIAGVGGDGIFKLWSSDWKELAGHRRPPVEGIPTSSVRISRAEIRRILLGAAQLDQDGAVLWNTRCTSISKLPTRRLVVETVGGEGANSRSLECDLVIVADGANSRIRNQLRPNDPLEYTGAVMRTGVSRFPDALPEQIERNWGFVLSGTGVSCFVSPVGKKDLQWAVGHFEDEASTAALDTHDAKETIQRASKLGSHIAEPFQTIISQTDPETVMCINAHDKLPFRHSDIDDMPVVFIGDSNHALSPFAGYGANLGLSDAWDLAEQLVKGTSLRDAVEGYDKISFPRASRVVVGARKRLRAGHSTGLRYMFLMLALAVSRALRWILGR
ncbi:hypothetical protein PWT90_01939 [Aphanocladium album]|nr:hypothetical protein PWT90_01939 [Aphanocladium album]